MIIPLSNDAPMGGAGEMEMDIIATVILLTCLISLVMVGGALLLIMIKLIEDAIKVARGSRSHYNLVIAIVEWWHQKSDPRWVAWREWK